MNFVKLSNGLEYEYILKPNVRAKRMILRVDVNGLIAVTTPKKGTSKKKVEKLIIEHEEWVLDKLDKKIEKVVFENNKTFDLFDETYRINHTDIKGGLTSFDSESKVLTINCKVEFLHRRVCSWIKEYIHKYFRETVDFYCVKIDKKCISVKVKNTKSRWGSCTSKGEISLCWLLAFAPKYVCDYVIAHECTHLDHLNHSRLFWRTLRIIYPETDKAERWLKSHGKSLFAYT